ncbi:unnamed protein product [Musa acuminata subsp. burmannicoides]
MMIVRLHAYMIKRLEVNPVRKSLNKKHKMTFFVGNLLVQAPLRIFSHVEISGEKDLHANLHQDKKSSSSKENIGVGGTTGYISHLLSPPASCSSPTIMAVSPLPPYLWVYQLLVLQL